MNKSGKYFDKKDLTIEITSRYGDAMDAARTQSEAVEIVLKALGAILPDALSEFGTVHIHGLGVFTLRHRAARKGWNFETDESVDIPPFLDVEFHPAPVVREIIAERTGQEVK